MQRLSILSAPSGALWSGKALFAITVWGASFVATRIALEAFTPVGLVAVRMVAGVAVLVAAGLVTRRSILPAREDRGIALLLGAILGGHTLIQAIGLRYTSAINAGWIIGFSPVPIALGGWLLLKQRLSGAGWAGLAVATSGVALIIAATTPGFAEARTGDALQLLSCFTWALYTLAGAGAVARNGALRMTVPAVATAAVLLGALTPWAGILHGPLTAAPAIATAFLGFVCSGAGFLLWYAALREHGAARAGSYLYLEPFVTVAVSAALLGEPISGSVVAGGFLVLAGVWCLARGSIRRAGALALLLAVSCLALGSTRAEESAANEVREIGEVVVLTPSGDAAAPKPLYKARSVRGWLKGVVGDPFDEHEVRRVIERHYDYLGYEPSIQIALSQGRLDVTIVEAPGAVGGIDLGADSLRGHVDPGLLEGLEAIDRPHVLTRTLRTSEGQLFNHERLARDEYDLSRLGYDIVPIPPAIAQDSVWRFAVTRRPRLGSWREARDRIEGGSDEAESSERGEEAEAGGVGPVPWLESGGESPGGDAAERRNKAVSEDEGIRPPIEPLRMGWLSTEAEYTRRSLFVARLFYERAHIFREFDSVEISPYVAQQLAGAIRYRLPYILPASVTTWNLFADVELYDEFVPDRLLEGVETDERRAGAKVALGIEPFVDRKGHSLRATGWVDRYHVTFGEFQIPVNGGIAPRSASVPGGRLNDVNLLGIEASWAYHHEFRAPRFWWEFRPRAEMATQAWGGDIAFRRVSGELRQHYAWSPGLELDTSWKGGFVDRDVPVFEEFALGGATSLRGFLRDDFLGRRVWSAQNDLWVPIPFRAFAPESDLMAALQRNLKTALIFDAGSVSFEQTLDVRFARGVGLGLRWQAEGSPLVVRVDAAWGYWRGERRFYPYLSFTRSW